MSVVALGVVTEQAQSPVLTVASALIAVSAAGSGSFTLTVNGRVTRPLPGTDTDPDTEGVPTEPAGSVVQPSPEPA